MTDNHSLALSKTLEKYYKHACLAEIEALKPGNVHIFADGHGMHAREFIYSAEQSAAVIALPNLSLGERIYRSVDATWKAVACNTNLGIILLCAPIIQSLLMSDSEDLRTRLKQVIADATKEDAAWVFKAIKLANPGGLGRANKHDVNEKADCSLLEAMQIAAETDYIAMQYSNGFAHVFDEGLHQYHHALLRTKNAAWAVTELFLYWLSHHPDSHVYRKHGWGTAQQVQIDALSHYELFKTYENPKRYLPELLTFDRILKTQKINPGTSADLTVATLLLHGCTTLSNNLMKINN